MKGEFHSYSDNSDLLFRRSNLIIKGEEIFTYSFDKFRYLFFSKNKDLLLVSLILYSFRILGTFAYTQKTI